MPGAFDFASHFRDDFYTCLTARGDALFEITDAMLCENRPVTSPVDLTLLAEHRRAPGSKNRRPATRYVVGKPSDAPKASLNATNSKPTEVKRQAQIFHA